MSEQLPMAVIRDEPWGFRVWKHNHDLFVGIGRRRVLEGYKIKREVLSVSRLFGLYVVYAGEHSPGAICFNWFGRPVALYRTSAKAKAT